MNLRVKIGHNLATIKYIVKKYCIRSKDHASTQLDQTCPYKNGIIMTGAHYEAFDFDNLTAKERYKLLIGTVVPRPIALVTTCSEDGRTNAAPFSFFNVLTAEPAIIALGIENHEDMTFKDTARNIRMREEFVVNVVDDALAEAMNICAIAFPETVDELHEAGLTAVPGTHVSVPRIAQAPAAFECVRHMTIELGRSREIVLGRVKMLHIRSDLVNTSNMHVDQKALHAVGRMGGVQNVHTSDLFDMPTPRYDEWQKKKTSPSKG